MKYGLIGFPISHSSSPSLFRAAYPDRPDLTYDLIEEEDFERAYARNQLWVMPEAKLAGRTDVEPAPLRTPSI